MQHPHIALPPSLPPKKTTHSSHDSQSAESNLTAHVYKQPTYIPPTAQPGIPHSQKHTNSQLHKPLTIPPPNTHYQQPTCNHTHSRLPPPPHMSLSPLVLLHRPLQKQTHKHCRNPTSRHRSMVPHSVEMQLFRLQHTCSPHRLQHHPATSLSKRLHTTTRLPSQTTQPLRRTLLADTTTHSIPPKYVVPTPNAPLLILLPTSPHPATSTYHPYN